MKMYEFRLNSNDGGGGGGGGGGVNNIPSLEYNGFVIIWNSDGYFTDANTHHPTPMS